MLHYWKRASGEAARDAARALSLDQVERAVFRISMALVSVAAVWWVTSDATLANLAFRILAGAIVLLAFPAVFVWKLLFVPPKMHS